jgi:hypothetical protein
VTFVAEEIASQPALSRTAATQAGDRADALPMSSARIAFGGCRTSLYVAQAAAAGRVRGE